MKRTPLTFCFVLISLLIYLAAIWTNESVADESIDIKSVALTYADDIAPIVQAKCVICHRENGTAPFSLHSFVDLQRRARQIVEVTQSRYMPPWLPSKSHFAFANDRSMTEAEISAIATWFRNGMTKGSDASQQNDAAERSGWINGEPDLILTLPTPYSLAADGPEVFWNFVLPAEIGPRFVRTVEVRPGNKRAVHHVIGLIDRTGRASRRDKTKGPAGFPGMESGSASPPPGQSILWSPGKVPSKGTEGIAWLLDSQTDIVLQMHMFPTGKPELVHPQLGLYFTDSAPTLHPISIMLEAAAIDIPPGVTGYEVTDEIKLPVNLKVLSLYPHAHYLANTATCIAILPDGKQQVLLNIDDWDFSWQDEYQFETAVELPKDTVIRMRFTYDNSAENVRNPNSPPKRVVLGNNSTDEMGSLLIQAIAENSQDRAVLDESRWQQMLRTNPMHVTANQNLGNILEQRGEHRKALGHYQRVLQVSQNDCVAEDNVACALSALGQYAEAEIHFRRALEIDSEYAVTHNHWGAALMRLDMIDEAIKRLNRALEIWPEFPEARVNLGEAELRRGQLEKAEHHFRLAARQNPKYALAHFNLGTILMNQQRHAEATECFRQAVASDDQFAEAFNNLGITLFYQGKLEDAAKQFRRSIELDADYVNPRQNLKVVEQQLKSQLE